ncbi:tail fiber protein [Crocinitomicaceae bacterium]|nr:tail fiber protein [Crocinitomicaceae bacterium]
MPVDPYLAEIMPFAGNFAVRGWAKCDGQLLSISANSALFSLLGTIYGGDGRTTFALPDMRGRVSMHPGNGPGLSSYRLGQKGGVEHVTLTSAQMPSHSHTIAVSNADSTQAVATSGSSIATPGEPAGRGITQTFGYANSAPNTALNSGTAVNTGGGQQHENRQPFLCVNYIICMQGIFPSRN